MGQADTRNVLLDWADDLQASFAARPAQILDLFAVDVLQSILFEFGLDEICCQAFTCGATETGTEVIA